MTTATQLQPSKRPATGSMIGDLVFVPAELRRLARAGRIVRAGRMRKQGEMWLVATGSLNAESRIHEATGETCDCADSTYRNATCKHIRAVRLVETMAHGLTFAEAYRAAVKDGIGKENAAGMLADGARVKDGACVPAQDTLTRAEIQALEARCWGGCWRYLEGCGCDRCEDAEALQFKVVAA